MLDNSGILTIALTQDETVLLTHLAKLDLAFSLRQLLNGPDATGADGFSAIYHLAINYEQFCALMRWTSDDHERALRQVNALTVFVIRNLIEGFPSLPNTDQVPEIAADVYRLGGGVLAAVEKAFDTQTQQAFLPVYLTDIKAKA